MNATLDHLRETIRRLEGRTAGFAPMRGDGLPGHAGPAGAGPGGVGPGDHAPGHEAAAKRDVNSGDVNSGDVNNGAADAAGTRWCFGLAAVDRHLPPEGLAFDACHDFTPEKRVDAPAVSSLVMMLLARLPRTGTVVWCHTLADGREHGRPYGPGLMTAGFDPGRLVLARLKRAQDFAFVLEEAVRSKAVAAVVGEGPALSFTATRRLSLMARNTGIPCLTVNTGPAVEASAAATRWRIAPAVGPPRADDPRAPGHAAWRLDLKRARGGRPHSWLVSWNDETHSFDLVAPFRDGTVLPANGPAGRVLALEGGNAGTDTGRHPRTGSTARTA